MFNSAKVYRIIKDGKRKRYKGVRPVIVADDFRPTRYDYYSDVDIRNIRQHTVEASPINREWGYWAESVCQTLLYITAHSVTGTGLRISTANKRALEVINKFNKKVNFKGQSIEDVIADWLIDNCMHGYAAWRILPTNESESQVVIDRMGPRTLIPVENSRMGYFKFIQIAEVDDDEPRSKKEFDRKYTPFLDETNMTYTRSTTRLQYIHIPSESCIYVDLYKRPPMSAALPYIVEKRWIMWYMKKAAEKFWSPTIAATVGTEDHFIEDPVEYERVLADVKDNLSNWHIFKAIAMPFDQKIEVLDTDKKQHDYTKEMEMLNKEIALSLFVSIGMVNPSGNDLATSRTIDENWQRYLQGLRRKIDISLVGFYNDMLLPLNGIEPQDDLTIDFSHLKASTDVEYIDMLMKAFEHGMFKDIKEYVKAGRVIWPWLDMDRPEKMPEYLKNWNEASQKQTEIKPSDRGNQQRYKNRPTTKTEPKDGTKVNKH